jgi:hypothetical protein
MVNHTHTLDLSPLSAIMPTQLRHTDGILATMLKPALICSMTIGNAEVKSRNLMLNDLIIQNILSMLLYSYQIIQYTISFPIFTIFNISSMFSLI